MTPEANSPKPRGTRKTGQNPTCRKHYQALEEKQIFRQRRAISAKKRVSKSVFSRKCWHVWDEVHNEKRFCPGPLTLA